MKMMPSYIGNTTSNAERKIFQAAASSQGLEGWFCLHSLGVSKHIYKREGEIDFLLIGEAGIFVIEVKGGRVNRENGIWKFTNRYGQVTEKRESPFSQAQSAMYSLRSDLAQKFGQDINRFLFGYGVALPDITFNTESPEWSLDTVYDIKDAHKSFNIYVMRLAESWRLKQRSSKTLSRQNINEIVQYLRGDFETVIPIGVKMDDSEIELLRLTEEQLSSLDAMEENPRIIFQGAAGTGKTLLALERARRNASSVRRTLMLCYNKYLAAYLKESLEAEGLDELITVKTVHSFLHEVIIRGGLKAELEMARKSVNANKIYSEVYPDLFNKSWDDSDRYDSLIIDEAQDVLIGNYIKPFSQIIKGGLIDGNWYMFLDPENQKDIFTRLDQSVLNEIKNFSTTFTLTVNCRNTKPIAIQTEVLSGIQTAKIKKVEGAPVQYIWYENESEQAVKVSDAVNKILSEGVMGGDVTILSPLRYSSSIAGTGKLRLKAPLYHLDTDNIASMPRDRIAYTSIQSFKGLESPVVVITDINQLDSDWDKIVAYVGLTRARTALIVAATHELKAEYRHRLKRLLESK